MEKIFINKKIFTVAIVATLALILLSVYFFVIRSSSTTIALPLIQPTKIYINTSNELIDSSINQVINDNSDKYIFAEQKEGADIIINNQKENNSQIIYSQPLVAVVHPQTFIDNLEIDQLNNVINNNFYDYDQIVISQQYINVLPDNLDISNEDMISVENSEQVIDYLYKQPKAIGFLPLNELNIQVHPLKINEISVFDKPEDYPLQVNTYISGNKEDRIDAFIEKIQPLPKNKPITSILAVGDIMMGRYVGVKIARSGDNTHSFQYVSDYLQKPDITFAQLETPIAPTTLTSEGMILIAQPSTVDGLVESEIDIVSISGNHFGDALRDGMEYTFNTLEENNILYIGAGRNEEEAFSHQVIEKNGTKFGFISYVNIMPSSYGAEGSIAGSAWVDFDSDDDLEKVKNSIIEAKNNCDVLLVGFHWGTEYTPHPTANQVKFAHAAIDSGADIVIGTHPHVVQADEIYQDKYIIYSLGNFIMDQMWSQETTEGVLLPIYVHDKQIIAVDLVPTQIIDYSQVKIISKQEGSHILRRIWDASAAL